MDTRQLLQEAARRSAAYLEEIQTRSVAPSPDAVARLVDLNEPIPQTACQPEEVLDLLDRMGSPATMAMAGPRFFGFVIGGSLPVTLAANWLAGAWDQNAAYFNATPSAAYLEQIALKWLVELLRLPPETGGAFVTGATMANFCCLAAARHWLLKQVNWDVEADGLFGAPEVTVIIGEEAHPTLIKALGLIGFGRNRVVKIPVDGQGRLRADQFPQISGSTLVCLQAGNVNTGAFDPFTEIIDKAHQAGAWVHIDGAFGLWAQAVPSLQGLSADLYQADSWATDAHKWLNVPYDCGLSFVRDSEALRAAMSVTAVYLPVEGENRNPSNFTPELSRRARGVEVWAALRSLGREGVIEMIERNCRQARRFAEGLKARGYQILNDVVLNQVLVSFGDPQKTQQVIANIQSDGTCWVGGTVWQGKTAMRISVSSWATTDEDVEHSLEAMIRATEAVS